MTYLKNMWPATTESKVLPEGLRAAIEQMLAG